jgi:hypothetical protein
MIAECTPHRQATTGRVILITCGDHFSLVVYILVKRRAFGGGFAKEGYSGRDEHP